MRRKTQLGFSVIEMVLAIAILMIVMGVVFDLMNSIEIRRRTEEEKVDVVEESRDFIDELARDLRNSGYPNLRMYQGCAPGAANPCVLGATPLNSTSVAAGLVAVSATDILFEGDVNQDGNVDSVRYTVQAGPNNSCPCTIRRSQVNKVAAAPTAQGTNYNVEMDNLINSAGGASAYALAGNTPWGAANDAFYASYKLVPVFSYFDQNNALVAVPTDLTGGNFATGQAAASTVRSVNVIINVLPPSPDLKTQLRSGVSLRTTVRIGNL